eukprot:TRINITY_DN7352_c0_g1_i1.p1 TRINITY_DN7352_c0_g1~~TRINITY_DN7352_c0_g1_i1.p1  ORF type:complete len:218 (+),score=19.28 TRINITY_DN7352_c0_g1_i1:188-841(+)
MTRLSYQILNLAIFLTLFFAGSAETAPGSCNALSEDTDDVGLVALQRKVTAVSKPKPAAADDKNDMSLEESNATSGGCQNCKGLSMSQCNGGCCHGCSEHGFPLLDIVTEASGWARKTAFVAKQTPCVWAGEHLPGSGEMPWKGWLGREYGLTECLYHAKDSMASAGRSISEIGVVQQYKNKCYYYSGKNGNSGCGGVRMWIVELAKVQPNDPYPED